MGLEIQKRDLRILKLCYEQQFLLVSHIKTYLFEGNYVEAKRRVRELKAAGLLEENPMKHRRAKLIQLSLQGKRLAADQSAAETSYQTRLDPGQVEHDSLVTEVRLRLEQLWKGVWIPERALRRENPEEIPDGILIFESGKQIAIEVENSLKGRSRFENRLKKWQHAPQIYIVLYVATTEDIFLHLKSWLQGWEERPLIALVRLSELMEPEPNVWSPIGELSLFTEESL